MKQHGMGFDLNVNLANYVYNQTKTADTMKTTATLLALAGSAAAFAPSSTKVCLSLFTWVGKELGFVDWLVIQVFDF